MPVDKNLLAAEGYFELEMYEDALEELALANKHPENGMEVLKRTLDIHIARKQWNDAVDLADALCSSDPGEPMFFIHLAYAHRELGQIEGARCAILDGPESIERIGIFHYNLACYEALLGEHDTAVETLEMAFELDPDLWETAQSDPDLTSIRDRIPAPPEEDVPF